jgi:WD40-like Beta Propeller Repeat
MKQILIVVAFSGVAGVSVLAQQPLQVAPSTRLGDASDRPLLHLDFAKNGQTLDIVTAVTSADGRRVQSFGITDARSAVWSPDGAQFAALAASAKGESLKIIRLNGPAATVFEAAADEGLGGWAPAWSPDGKYVAVSVIKRSSAQANGLEYFVAVVDVARKAVRSRQAVPEGTLKFPRHLSPPDKFRWSPDGRYILLSWEKAIVLDLEQGRTISISDQPVVAEWTPGGDGVLYFETASGGAARQRTLGGLYLKKLSGERVELASAETLSARGIALHTGLHNGLLLLSPSNSKLAIVQGIPASQRSSLRLYNLNPEAALDLGKPVKTVNVDEIIVKLEWSADERSVAAVMIPKSAVFPQGPFGQPVIKILTLANDEWRTVTMINFDLRQEWPQSLELLLLENVLSWTR